MNYTKRITALILALFSLLGLTACGQDPSANTEGGSTDGQKWVSAGRYEGTFSDEGYYYIPENQSSNLHYFDIATGATTVLCTKAGCEHKGVTCEAHITGLYHKWGGMCFWNGSLYYLDQPSADPIKLIRCNATGTEREVIGFLGGKYIEDQKVVITQNFARAGSFWYYCADVQGSVWDEETQRWNNERVLSYISRIDLRTGKEEILIEEEEHELDFYAAQEDAALFTVQGKMDVDNRDPDYQEKLSKTPILLKCWDGKTGQVSTLFEKNRREIGTIRCVYGDKVYYTVTVNSTVNQYKYNQYTFDLNTGEHALFSEISTIAFWTGGYAKCKDSLNDTEWYILELESGKKLPIDIAEGGVNFECGTAQGCILRWTVTGGLHRVCYVPYTALSDGLQEADLMQIYTWKNGYQ